MRTINIRSDFTTLSHTVKISLNPFRVNNLHAISYVSDDHHKLVIAAIKDWRKKLRKV